jgi:hypothetical protein
MVERDYGTNQQGVKWDLAPTEWGPRLLSGIPLPVSGAWDEQVIANVTTTFTDNHQVKIDAAAAFATGIMASEAIAATDIRYTNKIVLMLMSSLDCSAGDLELLLDDTALCASPYMVLDLPALKADEWYYLELAYDAIGLPGAKSTVSIGLRRTIAKGVQHVVYLRDWVRTYKDNIPIAIGDTGERITNMVVYGEPESVWVITEQHIGDIRSSVWTPAPIYGLEATRSEKNGKAALAHNVYLYFSFGDGGRIERFFRTNLDDVGPNRDAGLPYNRRGTVVDMVGFGDRLYTALDGGSAGISSVLVTLEGKSWHEVYRAPRAGLRIRKLFVQSIPGSTTARLWISMGADVIWIPISLDREPSEDYLYTHEGAIETGRIYAGMQDIEKYWRALKLATKNLSNLTTIRVEYRTDTSQTWVEMPDHYNESPFKELVLSEAANVTGRWIQLRIILETAQCNTTPEVVAWVMKCLSVEPVEWIYPLTFRAMDKEPDLNGNPTDGGAVEKINQVKEWMGQARPLLMQTDSELDNNKHVFINPAPIRRTKVINEAGQEVYVVQISLIEV